MAKVEWLKTNRNLGFFFIKSSAANTGANQEGMSAFVEDLDT